MEGEKGGPWFHATDYPWAHLSGNIKHPRQVLADFRQAITFLKYTNQSQATGKGDKITYNSVGM